MRILFINNEGGGFADYIEVDPGTTVSSLFDSRLPGRCPEDFLIRVNRLPASADQLLQEGIYSSILLRNMAVSFCATHFILVLAVDK